MKINTQANESQLGSGATPETIRIDRQNSIVVTDSHARFAEANIQGHLFSGGMTTTSISNATFTTGTLDATCTPIIGLWNPSTSNVNLIVYQARLQCVITAATATGGGSFVWATSTGNTAITTGSTPLSRKTLTTGNSSAKVFAGTALTGLTNSLTVREASALQGGTNGNYSMVGTAVGFAVSGASATIDHIDGAIIVPPGGVIALLATTTPVAISAASSILWEEVAF